jgi:hypothetical protein
MCVMLTAAHMGFACLRDRLGCRGLARMPESGLSLQNPLQLL